MKERGKKEEFNSIRDFPVAIQNKLMDRQFEQCGIRDLSKFETDHGVSACQQSNGMTWENSEEGYQFWSDTLHGYIDTFYEKYPKVTGYEIWKNEMENAKNNKSKGKKE